MSKLKTVVTTLLAAFVLVICADYTAFAATGQSLLLGKINTANKITTLTRTTTGPALKVTTKRATNAPFATNGKGRVANLNADRVDGHDSPALLNTTYVVDGVTANPDDAFQLRLAVPAGRYLITFSADFVAVSSLTAVGCAVRLEAANGLFAHSVSTIPGSPIGAGQSGAGFATVPAGKALQLTCQSEGGDFTVSSLAPARLTATRIDQVIKRPTVDVNPTP